MLTHDMIKNVRRTMNNIVEDLRNKDFLSTNDYNKIHMKPIIKKVEIEDEKEQDDDFDIGM